MSFGKLREKVEIMAPGTVIDEDGFAKEKPQVIATIRAYVEHKNATKRWLSRAVFSKATTLFRLRVLPGIKLDCSYLLAFDGEVYNILNVEDISLRGRYLEILAERVTASGKSTDETTG